jgi:anti-anti-sigma factor
VPLYSCHRCGWATASSWRDAVEGHDHGCPDCTGAVELVPLAGRPQENVAAVERVGQPFEMFEGTDLDGALRLTLLGGLDIVVADRLTARLRVLRSWGREVRIDLAALEFIDCTGLEAIMDELASARRAGHAVEVDRPVSAPVKRVITFMDVADVLWPQDADAGRPMLRVIEGEAPTESVDAIRRPPDAHPLGLFGDPAERRPTSPGASASSDR